MTKPKWVVASALLILGVLFPARTADAQADQRILAQQLLGPNVQQRNRTLNAVRRMEVTQIKDDLRIALIGLLNRTNEVVGKRAKARQPLDQVEDPNFVAALSRDVARLGDARAIPALSEAVYGGTTVTKALAAFGEAAVPDLLRIVNSPDAHYDLVDHALLALRMMVERPEYASGSAMHQKIKAATAQRLRKPGYFTTLWQAIDLASVLRDPELRQLLQGIAASPHVLTAMGIYEPVVIERTQKRAADRLAGVAPMPR